MRSLSYRLYRIDGERGKRAHLYGYLEEVLRACLVFGVDFPPRFDRYIPRRGSAKGEQDEKLIIILFALVLLMSAVAVAQYGTQQPDTSKSSMSMKAVSITGKISDDGKTFVSDKDSKSWTISNPDAVKGHEGHHVTLQEVSKKPVLAHAGSKRTAHSAAHLVARP
jgi:hypothetical protein